MQDLTEAAKESITDHLLANGVIPFFSFQLNAEKSKLRENLRMWSYSNIETLWPFK